MSGELLTATQPRAKIDGGFWKSCQDLVRQKVIPYQWKAMNDEIPGAPKSHSVENFRIAAGVRSGGYEGMVFQDSDLAKWLEAAGYLLAEEDPGAQPLRGWVDEAVDLIARAQQPDGYLNTYFTVKDPAGRWKNLREAHELYCAGHLIEAGVSLFQAGNQRILHVVRRLADHIDSTFGPQAGKVRGYSGHEEVELALVRLARATGERRYLRLASFFVEERGRSPSFFQTESSAPGYRPIFGVKSLDYYQAHLPVREQPNAVGHAVRAMYLYTAMADLALETSDRSLSDACERLWISATRRKMYITGGIGSSAHLESFGADFDLPNDTAYAETCAAIGLFLFSARMARLRAEAKYVDVMERTLYNGILSGLALDGESYFYVNPLAVVPSVCDGNGSYRHVRYRRQPWYGCACCPPNIARLLASLGEYLYHEEGDTVYADLYHQGSIRLRVGSTDVRLRQKTRYPWDGRIHFLAQEDMHPEFTLALRLPSWCQGPTLSLNGAPLSADVRGDGYARVRRRWSAGDHLELTLPMPVVRVRADPRVGAAAGKVALQRGPIVYCLEEVDNGPNLSGVRLPADAPLEAVHREDLLGGVMVVRTVGRAAEAPPAPNGELYTTGRPGALAAKDLLFVPYYAWANRAPGEMAVWIRE